MAQSARNYDPVKAGVKTDLAHRLGPIDPVLATVDPLVAKPISLSNDEFQQLVAFVRKGLLDDRAAPAALCGIAPAAVPSGASVFIFEDCKKQRN